VSPLTSGSNVRLLKVINRAGVVPCAVTSSCVRDEVPFSARKFWNVTLSSCWFAATAVSSSSSGQSSTTSRETWNRVTVSEWPRPYTIGVPGPVGCEISEPHRNRPLKSNWMLIPPDEEMSTSWKCEAPVRSTNVTVCRPEPVNTTRWVPVAAKLRGS